MKRMVLFMALFFLSFVAFTQDIGPWGAQNGYAVVAGKRYQYWLYDTASLIGAESSDIYNRYIPNWVESKRYVIDYDHIKVYDPNPNIASSVKALMQQRGCDVIVLLDMENQIYETVRIHEWSKSEGTYKTTVYPLYNYALYNSWANIGFGATSEPLINFGVTSPRGIIDLGVMSDSAARQRVRKEFEDFLEKENFFSYGYWDSYEVHFEDILRFIVDDYPQPKSHLYKIWYDSPGTHYPRSHFVGFVYFEKDVDEVFIRIYEMHWK
jgi:hypothetical protein